MGNETSTDHDSKNDHHDNEADEIDFDVDDASQEALVNENDLREEAHTFTEIIKTTNILQCIGKLVCNFKYSSGKTFSARGTATVFKTHNGYVYALTAAHNCRHTEYWDCTNCQRRNKKRKCDQCSIKSTSKHILKAGKIYFNRKTLKGELIGKYKCDIVWINDVLYEKHPFPPAGYDSAIIKFEDDEGYYENTCKNIMLLNGRKFYKRIKSKKNSFYIFGYPAFVKGETTQQENMWGAESIEDEFEVIKHKKTGCFYLTQNEIDASVGTSGAAIFSIYKINNVHYTAIFGMHTGGKGNDIKYKSGAFNIGILLDEKFDAEYDKKFNDLLFVAPFGNKKKIDESDNKSDFGKRDIKKELEQEDSAVISAFGSDNNNKKSISQPHTNLFPNITAP
eukprot:92888_1